MNVQWWISLLSWKNTILGETHYCWLLAWFYVDLSNLHKSAHLPKYLFDYQIFQIFIKRLYVTALFSPPTDGFCDSIGHCEKFQVNSIHPVGTAQKNSNSHPSLYVTIAWNQLCARHYTLTLSVDVNDYYISNVEANYIVFSEFFGAIFFW